MFLVLVLLSAYLLVFRCELKGSIWIILRTISVLQKKKKKTALSGNYSGQIYHCKLFIRLLQRSYFNKTHLIHSR